MPLRLTLAQHMANELKVLIFAKVIVPYLISAASIGQAGSIVIFRPSLFLASHISACSIFTLGFYQNQNGWNGLV